MTDPQPDPPPQSQAPSRSGRLALVVALLALAAAAAPWLGIPGRRDVERARGDELAKTQRRLSSLDDRLQRDRDDLSRLIAKLGTETEAEDSLTGRVTRLEASLDKLPGGARARSAWMLEQAEYFLRIANAQESLAGDTTSALTALEMADEHLREAGDPRLTPVRRLVASEIAALRALPRVDTEGLALKLGALADALPELPRRLSAPPSFRLEPAAADAAASGLERVLQVLRNALLSVVSVRRTDAPSATLLTEESATLLMRTLDLELQMARLALLRREAVLYRESLASARRDIEDYFDVASPAVTGALATLDELARAPLPDARPDVSASLAELLKFRETQDKS